MAFTILLLLGIAFVGYAVYAHYNTTDPRFQQPPGTSVAKRVWASMVAAAVMFGAAIADWFGALSK